MPRVRVTERGGQQFLDGLTNQFTGRPAEHRFEGAIGRLDHTVRVHGRDALRRSLQQQSQLAIVLLVTTRLQCLRGAPPLGDVEARFLPSA